MTERSAVRAPLSSGRFFALVGATAIAVYAFLALWTFESYQAAISQAEAELQALAQINAVTLGLHLRNARRAAEELDAEPAMDNSAIQRAVGARLSGTDVLEVFDARGQLLATTAPEAAAANSVLVSQFTDYHRPQSAGLGWAFERQGRHWLPVLYRTDKGQWIVISLPIETILANWMRPRWKGLNPIGLRSGVDRILLRFPFAPEQLGRDASASSSAALIREAVLRGEGHGTVHTVATETDNVDRLIGWALVPGSSARALVATDVADVRAHWVGQEGSKFALLAVLIAAAFAAWTVWRFRVVGYRLRLEQATVLNSQALDASADTTWVMRHDGTVVLGEGAPWLRRSLGAKPAAAISFDAILKLADAAGAQRFSSALQAAAARLLPVEHVLEFRDVDGVLRTILVRGAPLPAQGRAGEQMVGTIRDVTELASANRRLHATSKTLTRACELAQIGPWHVDVHTLQLTLSDTAKGIYGLPESYGPTPWLDFQGAGGEHQRRLMQQRKRLLETGEGYSELCSVQRSSDGATRWIKSVASPVFDGDRLVAVEGSVQDVTALVEVQGKLHAHELTNRLLSNALEVSSQAVAITDEHGLISWTNAAYLKRTGLSTIDVLDQQIESTLQDIAPDGSVSFPRLRDLTLSLREDASPRIRVRSREDETVWFDVEVRQIAGEQGAGDALVWVLTDVTRDVEREAALQDTTRRFELATRNAQIGIWEVDLVHSRTHWSDAVFRMYDLTPCAVPLDMAQVIERIHPDDREAAVLSWRQALKSAQLWDSEFRVLTADGGSRWLKSSCVIERDASNRATRMIGNTVDTTASHEIESERSSRHVAEAHTQAKNVFLSRMSHELRTPLNAIIGYTQLLRQRLAADREADARLNRVETAGWHLLSLIDEVLDLSRIESGTIPLSLSPVGLEQALHDSLALVEPQASKARVTLDLWPTTEWVLADAKRVKQIVVNLLSNATKYNRAGGHVWVDISRTESTVVIAVRDDGIGMTEDQLARLFNPFDRLGREQSGIEGTGIGLTICKTLAERMGGSLTARSTPEQGTVFELCLPAAEPVAQPAPSRPVEAGVAATMRKVLCVEDNLVNALLLEEALHTTFPGWPVRRAATVAQAKDRILEERFDYVLLDLNLPDGQGVSLLDDSSIRDQLPADRVILLTADATDHATSLSSRYGLRGVLTKPFRLKDLSDLLV